MSNVCVRASADDVLCFVSPCGLCVMFMLRGMRARHSDKAITLRSGGGDFLSREIMLCLAHVKGEEQN